MLAGYKIRPFEERTEVYVMGWCQKLDTFLEKRSRSEKGEE
jgi:hypothetical protein